MSVTPGGASLARGYSQVVPLGDFSLARSTGISAERRRWSVARRPRRSNANPFLDQHAFCRSELSLQRPKVQPAAIYLPLGCSQGQIGCRDQIPGGM